MCNRQIVSDIMLLLLYDNETYIFDKNNSDDVDQRVPRMTARVFEGK